MVNKELHYPHANWRLDSLSILAQVCVSASAVIENKLLMQTINVFDVCTWLIKANGYNNNCPITLCGSVFSIPPINIPTVLEYAGYNSRPLEPQT